MLTRSVRSITKKRGMRSLSELEELVGKGMTMEQVSELNWQKIDANIDKIVSILYSGGSFSEAAELTGLNLRIFRNNLTRIGLTKEFIAKEGPAGAVSYYKVFRSKGPRIKTKPANMPKSTPVMKYGMWYFACEECGKIAHTMNITEWTYKVRKNEKTYYDHSYTCWVKTRKKLRVD